MRKYLHKITAISSILLFSSLLSIQANQSVYPLKVTDIAQQEVTFDRAPERIILGTGRTIYALDILFENDLINNIVAWRNDLIKNDDDSYQQYRKQFPLIEDIPFVGSISKGEFDIEFVIGLKADLLLLDLGHYTIAKESGLINKLNSVGTKTIFIDFKEDPLNNTTPSIKILGTLFNRQINANRFNEFYEKTLNLLKLNAASIKNQKRIFIERAAGINGLTQCCRTWGKNNLGLIAQTVGLENIGSKLLPGASGEVSMEKVLTEKPDLYVMSAANWAKHRADAKNIPLGYSVNPNDAQRSFPGLLSRPGFDALKATKNQDVYALFHQFYNSPFNIIAAMYLAKWAYPDTLASMNPDSAFKSLHDEFLTPTYQGTFALKYKPTAINE